MIFSRSSFPLAAVALLILAGCSADHADKNALREQAHYWQRTNTTSALFMSGPKALQILNRDISRCVVEIRELTRLGAIRQAIPPESDEPANAPDPATFESQLAAWNTPERDGALRVEHLDYYDFEGCMEFKGWERLAHVPFDVAEESRATYFKSVTGQEYRGGMDKKPAYSQKEKGGDWDNLNN